MSNPIHRRLLLKTLALASAAATAPSALAAPAATSDRLALGAPVPFSFERLQALARRLAAAPYAPPPPPPEIVAELDYQAWGEIKFDTDHALFKDGPLPVTFFHRGEYFPNPVKIFAVENGQAREVIYDPSYFHMPPDSPARRLPEGGGFAGFRVQEPRRGRLDWRTHDWVAFLGGSYLRAIGGLHQYGLSARAIAIDTTVAEAPEEFPRFSQVFIERPSADTVTVCALLEGPSVAGACRFRMTRGTGVVMDVDQTLFLRRKAFRLGLAPLTSMYWFSETVKSTAEDWRPEVHDSDGLAMWTGAGERVWRPLNNPPQLVASAFSDENPKGFGLLQRDRNFDHYLDGVFYDRRPSLWVEPKGDWGKGSVQLIEIPTNDETMDNIVAAWVPEQPPAPGAQLDLSYRLHWLADEPYPGKLAHCVATRLGRGGQPGRPRPDEVRKFVVEFLGGPLAGLPYGVKPQMALHATRGRFTDYQLVEPIPDSVPGHWRAEFDLADVRGRDPVELRLQLTVHGAVATETWAYQYHPF
ncbi:glucan biosynthesis protein D [Phenylobacterium sp. LjRoot225]|uniref:glucan biosynthesis protein n=1 Tax=Phenylobacterium sp. LjRoot225 TaxID=3342285 RepID=UPI003ECC7EEC